MICPFSPVCDRIFRQTHLSVRKEIVPEESAAIVEQLTGKKADREEAKKGTIAYSILKAHNTSDSMDQLRIKFDSMASHDITFVGIIQTARASGMDHFPMPYVLTNCPDLPEDVAEKLTALKAQTEKRNSAERKPTAKQVANLDLAEHVVEVLKVATAPMTVTEIMAQDDTLSALSNQKVSALIRGLGDRVVKTVDKRVSKFSLA
jgi:hypothetical protein